MKKNDNGVRYVPSCKENHRPETEKAGSRSRATTSTDTKTFTWKKSGPRNRSKDYLFNGKVNLSQKITLQKTKVSIPKTENLLRLNYLNNNERSEQTKQRPQKN